MTKQMRHEYKSLVAITLIVLAVGALIVLMPRAANFQTVSSKDLDETLYEHLDEYLLAYENDPALSEIFAKALSDPASLGDEDRRNFLAMERKFLSGWELAWTYRQDGQLGTERYAEWDTWYAGELERRPRFVWTENKAYFSSAFTQHVEDSTNWQ